MRKQQKPSLKYRVLRFLCRILGIVLVLMLSVTLFFQFVLHQVQFAPPDDISVLSQEELDEFLGINPLSHPIMAEEETPAVSFPEHHTQIGGLTSPIINILLIGQDRREGEARSRSDSMILCTFHKNTKTMTMTSFLRDLYVEIPGYRNNRINAAYAAGGMPLLKKTFQKNFGIHIDGCVEVDFSQFPRLIDLMGGVSMELRQDEAELLNTSVFGASLEEGMQLLNGEQALAYARIRKLDADGDFSRTARQRKIISALLDQFKKAKLSSTMVLFEEAMSMLGTDMKAAKLLTLAAELLPMLPDMEIVSQRIPAEGTYSDQMIQGMAVLVADMDANRRYLEDTLLAK